MFTAARREDLEHLQTRPRRCQETRAWHHKANDVASYGLY
jgi:hypothetical protein